MEDKTTIVIDVQLDEGNVATELAKVNREMAALRAENTSLKKDVKDGKKTWEDVSQALATNEARLKQLKASQSALSSQVVQSTNKTLEYGSSLKEQSALLSELRNRYQSLNKTERESAQGQDLLKHIQELDEAVKSADYSQGQFQRNVGNYPGAMAQANEQLRAMTEQLEKLKIEGKDDTAEFANLSQQIETLKATIESSANEAVKPVTAQIKEMTRELVNMRLEGKANTEEYNALLAKVGQLTDMMMDAQREVKQMASDTGALNTVLDGAKAAAGGFSAALGVMTLLGDKDSETAQELAEAQKNLQAAIAVTTGLQAVQNALQKESALMMGVNKVRILAAAAAQKLYAAATRDAEAAQAVFNKVAKSNIYVWLASIILSVVGAIYAFTRGSKEQEEQLKKTNDQLNNQLNIIDKLTQRYVKMYDSDIKSMQNRIELMKAQGKSIEDIERVEDALYEIEVLRAQELLSQYSDIIENMDEYEAKLEKLEKDVRFYAKNQTEIYEDLTALQQGYAIEFEKYPEIIGKAHDEQVRILQDFYDLHTEAIGKTTAEIDSLQKAIDKGNEALENAQDVRTRRAVQLAERNKAAAEQAKAQAAKQAEAEKRLMEERKRYEEQTLSEIQKAEDALNALITDGYEQRRTIEETAYKRSVADLQQKLKEEKELHGEGTALYNAYLSQLESLRIDHERKMSDIAQEQFNDERSVRDTAIKQLEADNALYWENRINEAILQGKKAGEVELEQLKENLDNLHQYELESDAEFYARRLEAQKAYNEKKQELAEAEKAIEKAKSEYIASIAGSISSTLEAVANENKTLVAASKVVALAEVAIKQGVAIAEAVAASSAGDPYTYALRVASAVGTTLAAMAQAVKSINSASFETGGVIGGFRGASMGSDNTVASVRNGEMVLNARQQKELFEIANGGNSGVSLAAELAEAVRNMPAPILDMQEFTRFNERVATMEETSKLR